MSYIYDFISKYFEFGIGQIHPKHVLLIALMSLVFDEFTASKWHRMKLEESSNLLLEVAGGSCPNSCGIYCKCGAIGKLSGPNWWPSRLFEDWWNNAWEWQRHKQYITKTCVITAFIALQLLLHTWCKENLFLFDWWCKSNTPKHIGQLLALSMSKERSSKKRWACEVWFKRMTL